MNEEKDIKETVDEKVTIPPKVSTKEKREKTHEDYFKGGMLLLVGLIVAIAALQFYFTVDNIIYTWFEYQYVPIIKAFYNLAVIVIGLYILSRYILKKEKK